MRKQTHWLCALLFFSFAVSAAAQEYTSRQEVLQNEELRRDFNIQGEYLATAGGHNVGLHLIADGGGKFRFVAYVGGLPGEGWKRGEPRVLGTAVLDGDTIIFDLAEQRDLQPPVDSAKGEVRGTITFPQRPQGEQGARQQGGQGQPRGALVRIETPAGGERPAFAFEKQNRRSETLNQSPPEGAVVIFDGTNLDKFRDGAQINEVPVPQREGAGQQGQGQRRNQNTLWAEAATTAFEKKPYKMHIEFMLSYMPQARGQARSNSGVYIDERHELQVLDSFGLEGRDNECGGFYQFAGPIVNMCFPPLTWQTYDIDFTPARWDGDRKIANARVTVKHNGVLIQDNLELTNHTPGRRNEGPEPLGVYLQGHGNKVQYRNIWIQYQDWAEPVVQAATAVEEPAERPRGRRQQSGITAQQPVNPDVPAVTATVVAPDAVATAELVVEETAIEESAPPRRRVLAPQARPLFPRLRATFQ